MFVPFIDLSDIGRFPIYSYLRDTVVVAGVV